MNTPPPLPADDFRRHYPWLTAWFRRASEARFADSEQELIAAELGRRWDTEHPLAVLHDLRARFGGKVAVVVGTIVHENARADWAEIAAQRPAAGGIDDFMRLLWEPLRSAGFEFTTERRDGGVQIRCTRCPHVALARELGAADWMTLLLCGSDPAMVAGFNPAIGFRRTKTLLEGDDCCDHFYFPAPPDPAGSPS